MAAAVAVPVVALLPARVAAAPGDGSGTMTVSPTYTINNSTGNFFTFTYTAAGGGISDGELALVIPAGWSAPDLNGFNPGAINALCGDFSPTITGTGPWTFTVHHVTLAAGNTCDIHYGINTFGTVTAPSATGTHIFTAQSQATAAGTLASLATSPSILVDTDGTGTMTVVPASALVSSAGNTHTFHYTATRTMSNGELTLLVPGNWSTPSTTGSAPGFTTSTCGTVAVVTNTIHVTAVTLANGAACDIVYGATTSGGPGATAPSVGGTQTFTVQHQSDAAHNNLQAIAISPAISVVSPDGAGTMTVTPTSVITSSSGNFFTFTYTPANPGGLTNGELTLLIPTGWSAPDLNGFNPGAINATCGDFSPTITGTGPWTFHVHNVTLLAGDTCDIHYGINTFGTVVAPSSPGLYTFTTQQRSVSTGTLTSLATSPQIMVGDDGTGTLTVAPDSALVSSTANTLVFTYTAARTITGGELDVAVPAGWSAPSTTGSNAGFTTSTCGTVGIASTTVQVTAMNLANGATCTITFGSTVSGGPGANAPAAGGTSTFTTQQKSASAGTLTPLGTGSPQVFVVAADGTGTMTVTPTAVINNSTGNFFTFTYTAVNPGGLHDGELTLVIPAGWSAPDLNGFNPGAINALCGDFSPTITGSGPWTFTVHNVTLAAGDTCDIHYGINTFGTVTAPAASGVYNFTAHEKSRPSGTLTSLASSPQVLVGSDGTGTMTVAPTTTLVSSTGNTLVFTYTSVTTLTNGQIDIAAPAGWSAPSTTGANAGFTTSTCGTVGVVVNTIQVTAINLAAAATCTLTYGSTTGGGPGATAPSAGGTSTFGVQQKSSSGGSLTPLAAGSPQVFVVSADGTGTMTVAPGIMVPGSTANALTFTYTAATGSLHDGEITLVVPADWTEPDTNGFNPGGTNATCGDSPVTIAGSGPWTIHVVNVNLVGGATCDIHYGIFGFGTVTAPSAAGTATFAAQERSLSTGVLTSLAISPQVVIGTDGAGTLTVAPVTSSASSTGNTLTFVYTAPIGGLSGGEIDIAMPAGWSAPSTTAANPGFTTTDCPGASVAIVGSTVQVTGINLAAAATCAITYGATTSGGPGATAPSAPGVSTFATQQKSTVSGTLTNLTAGSPQVTVFAADGSGTLTVSPTSAGRSSNGNTLVFTYTAATGGTNSGQINVAVPAGWTTPSTTGSNQGFTQSTCGSVAIAASTIQVSGVNLAGAATCTITYGSTSSGGAGASAPSVPGVSTFAAQQKSTGAGVLTSLASSPQVSIPAPTVALDFAAVSIPEGDTGATTSAGLHAVLDSMSGSDVVVHVRITGGTATAGTDTSPVDTDLTISAGQTSVLVPLNVLGDVVVEGDETAQLTLSVVSGATLGSPSVSTVTITDNDVATLTVNSADVVNNQASIVEGGATLPTNALHLRAEAAITQLTLAIDHPSAHDITLNVITIDGTATAPADYTPINSTFTIPAGQTTLSIPLHAVADGIDEPNETFTVRFVSASGATLNAPDITITIIDNDVPVVPPTMPPGGGGLPVTGSSPIGPLAASAVLLVLGATMLIVRRRTRPS